VPTTSREPFSRLRETHRTALFPPAGETRRTALLPPAGETRRTALLPRAGETRRTALLPRAGEGGAKRRMRVRAQRAALALLQQRQPRRAGLDRPLFRRHQDQGLSRRDGASHLSLLVQRNLAQRKHPPPARPVLCTGSAEPAGFSERAS